MAERKRIILKHTREPLAEGAFRTLREAIVEGQLKPVDTSLASEGRKEQLDLEAWIASDPTILRWAGRLFFSIHSWPDCIPLPTCRVTRMRLSHRQ